MSVSHSARSGGIIGIIFSIKVCCVLSLESPHRGDSNKILNIPFSNKKKKITLSYPKSSAMGFYKGLKNEFETVVVNEP